MTEVKGKAKYTHGGAREPITITSSQGRFLHVLWELYGGATEVGRTLGISSRLPVNWKVRGRVPLKYTGKVSRGLQVPPELLNYEQVVAFKGKGPSWKKVVADFELREKHYKYVMAGKQPKSVEKILEDG